MPVFGIGTNLWIRWNRRVALIKRRICWRFRIVESCWSCDPDWVTKTCGWNGEKPETRFKSLDMAAFETWFDFIKLNPHKCWDYSGLSKNPNITWDIVAGNPDKAWNYDYLSENPNITWDIVSANPEKAWNYELLCYNQMAKHPFFQRQLSYVLK